jgi:hypothetical protein
MMNEEAARQLAIDYLENRGIHNLNGRLEMEEIVITSSISKEYAFIYLVNSKKYLETMDFDDCVFGVGPLIVLKETGRVIELVTAYLPEDAIEEFEIKAGFLKLSFFEWIKYKIKRIYNS